MIVPRAFLAACGCVGVMLIATACSNDNNNTPTTPSCSFSVAQPTTTTFGPAGGTGTVAVTAASGCAWTAASSATFVAVTAGASGSGNGTVTITVAANTGSARTATLTVAGSNFTISQSAAAPTGTPGSLSAPTPTSPVGGQGVTVARPPLVVTNAAATGTVGTVTYRFEISDQPTFPNDPFRTFSVDGVAQGTGSTTGVVPRDLGTDVLWYWHARATDGTVTSAYSVTETFRTPSSCAFSVSPTLISIGPAGGTKTITVTTGSTCAWTATSSSPFITLSTAGGTGSGTVDVTVPPGTGVRTFGLTIAGQTVTIGQGPGPGGSANISASFNMTDPGLSGSPTTECRITSGIATVCSLQSTSFPLSTNALVSFDWTVSWTDGSVQSRTQVGTSPTFSFTWTCGGPNSTAEGALQPLAVTLTVTDSSGASATVTAGSGSQPPLFLRLFKC